MSSFIVDLHVHSYYSRATSKNCTLEGLYYWGKIKGINVIGTGDFTHPLWFREINQKLELQKDGLYSLREDIAQSIDKTLPLSVRNVPLKFIPTVEISNIYSKNSKLRKVHNLIVIPTLEAAQELNSFLKTIGNLEADGRPILGMDSKALLKAALIIDKNLLFIPAHIWTPWFGMFGSKSGFNSIEETFEELSPMIYAVETGLSSDPYMNWRCKELQQRTIVSNSDAHSPQKLGREATVLNTQATYSNIVEAITRNDDRITGTIEFFPAEGKYHYDGHRLCKVRLSPEQTKDHKGICPVCGHELTKGVDYRVDEIADYAKDYKPPEQKQVEYIVPLAEIISEIKSLSSQSKKVQEEYINVISNIGNEFDVLRNISIKCIKDYSIELGELIHRMRNGEVSIEPGYDGVYGKVKLLRNEKERDSVINPTLFDT